MIFKHYSVKPITEPLLPYEDLTQHLEKGHVFIKPKGFWVSVEGEDDWPTCMGEEISEMYPGRFSFETDITLKSLDKIKVITTNEEFLAFHKEYAAVNENYSLLMARERLYLNIKKLIKDFSGLIIATYFSEYRLIPEFDWYYGWDCASGCIWDVDLIEIGQHRPYQLECQEV